MKKFLCSISAAFLCLSAGSSFAQDSHFTQYFASPLTLNPAHTGLTTGDYRVSVIGRSQWYTVTNNPYMTGALSYDMPILKGKLPEGDAAGFGLQVLYDKAGSGALQNITSTLSLAYHKALGVEKNHRISLGVQGSLVQKSIRFDKLVFGNEIDFGRSTVYLPNTSGEGLQNADLTYPDFNAGILYSGQINENTMLYGGFSYYHLTRPTEKFTSRATDVSVKINSRYTAYVGGALNLNSHTVAYLSTMYQQQGTAWEYLIGGAVGFILNPYNDEDTKNTTLYLGAWYRYGDAIAPYVGFEWSNWQMGFTYDVNVSKFQQATNGQGAVEFSATYNGIIEKIVRKRYNFACPKF
ncbi:PorP/SprF family type IX secretion system membrane protein [Edaphocola flava]|jgi:type IX secretion system PorP/SprF family membrane protein|uniref:PorP/SprF family type IX secretion system membrane protein n=1 Tax=Edaphocola flava TaxID=2499629 RepID=UPI00100B8DCC|nr:PorP/SprF family type IX secretion system membrane protein [Edaphocola flava]